MSKKVLIDLGEVRIIESDKLNLEVQAYETYRNPIKKEYTTDWRFKGYYADVFKALKGIINRNMLIDNNAIKDIETALKEHDKQTRLILNKLEEMK